MGFINEAKYRLTDKEAKTPSFFKKLANVGKSLMAAGTAFAFVPGGLIIGGVAAGIGFGLTIGSYFTTGDKAADVSVKAEIKKIEKREEKKAEKEVTKNP